MATNKPRVTVTLEPRAYEVLSRLSAAGGESMSALLAQLLEVSIPSLERVVLLLERAHAAPKEAHAGLAAAMERAERHLTPLMLGVLHQGDMFVSEAASTLPPVAADGRTGAQRTRAPKKRPPPVRRDPPLVTRGSGQPKRGGARGKRG